MALTLDLIIRFRLLSDDLCNILRPYGINGPPAVAERPLHPQDEFTDKFPIHICIIASCSKRLFFRRSMKS